MPTRGLYGFRKNGADKLTYNHLDSYPKWLGNNIIDFCRSMTAQELNDIFDRLEMVSESGKPDAEQLKIYQQWEYSNENVLLFSNWHSILLDVQGNMDALKTQRYMADAKGYIKTSDDCNFAYIINLDNNTLEFWIGNQTTPQQENRYGTDKKRGHYPCRLALTFPLDRIPENAMEQMEAYRLEEKARERGEIPTPSFYDDISDYETDTENEDEDDLEI